MESLFRLNAPTEEHLKAFHQDGYVALTDIFTDEARTGLIDEILNLDDVRTYLHQQDVEDATEESSRPYFVRPWNNRGYWGDRLIDAPLVTALIQATIGTDYHFCHSALNLAQRGAKPIRLHMDHHHWFHENPINLAERDKWYIQILYYPNGFTRGDRSLSVIPGSHRVAPTPDVTAERLLAGEFDEQAGRKLELQHLELPPGSMVYLNARMFHGVAPKPIDSPQAYRIFVIDIFKEVGPPHRHTQEIPTSWLEQATPLRQRLFQREPYTPNCWHSDTE
ncbi:phytanoyl-CoA dioxygenase family protein [Chloroflexi bacterium TSY]|nr:phytanoyl-CoA dioxygenase family protein [Chloroflexi bacterium TSY]